MDHELDEMVLLRNAWRIAKLDRDKYYWRAAELHGRLIKLTSQQFVDDATLMHGGDSNDSSGETVLASMQEVLDHWEGAL